MGIRTRRLAIGCGQDGALDPAWRGPRLWPWLPHQGLQLTCGHGIQLDDDVLILFHPHAMRPRPAAAQVARGRAHLFRRGLYPHAAELGDVERCPEDTPQPGTGRRVAPVVRVERAVELGLEVLPYLPIVVREAVQLVGEHGLLLRQRGCLLRARADLEVQTQQRAVRAVLPAPPAPPVMRDATRVIVPGFSLAQRAEP